MEHLRVKRISLAVVMFMMAIVGAFAQQPKQGIDVSGVVTDASGEVRR